MAFREETDPTPISDLVKYYENSSFFWTLSGVVKPSPSMGFRCQRRLGLKSGQSNLKKNFVLG
jgi:hypothetical protein